jgi:REP element-mobilizing transposase RayT
MHATGIWNLRCATVMPDHVHLFFELGDRLTLGQAVGRLRASVTRSLRPDQPLWQEGFEDRRLRSRDDLLPVFLYLFLNPYRANLTRPEEQWPWFHCSAADWQWFEPLSDENCAFPEWLRE